MNYPMLSHLDSIIPFAALGS